jgi:hypothetical protein
VGVVNAQPPRYAPARCVFQCSPLEISLRSPAHENCPKVLDCASKIHGSSTFHVRGADQSRRSQGCAAKLAIVGKPVAQRQGYVRNDLSLAGADQFWEDSKASPEIVRYWLALKYRARLIICCAIASGLVTLLVTKFVMTPLYRANALLRPNSEQTVTGKISGLAMMSGASLGEMVTGMGPQSAAADEYMQILKSYDFTMALVDQYHLRDLVFPQLRKLKRQPSDWSVYRMFLSRFDCTYDRIQGSLTLHFMDSNRAVARQVLGLYIKNLSNELRQSDARGAGLAATALRDEAQRTSDVLLQAQLYRLMSHQIEQERLAQVESDFAFKIIQSPVVPDRPYKPSVLFDTFLAAGLTLFLVSFAVLVSAAVAGALESQGSNAYGDRHNDVGRDRTVRLSSPEE